MCKNTNAISYGVIYSHSYQYYNTLSEKNVISPSIISQLSKNIFTFDENHQIFRENFIFSLIIIYLKTITRRDKILTVINNLIKYTKRLIYFVQILMIRKTVLTEVNSYNKGLFDLYDCRIISLKH